MDGLTKLFFVGRLSLFKRLNSVIRWSAGRLKPLPLCYFTRPQQGTCITFLSPLAMFLAIFYNQ